MSLDSIPYEKSKRYFASLKILSNSLYSSQFPAFLTANWRKITLAKFPLDHPFTRSLIINYSFFFASLVPNCSPKNLFVL